MAIFRGTTGTGSSDNTIVSAVTEQAGIATTKADEASASASTATTKASEASASATTATNKAGEASADATIASTKATEANTAKGLAEDAQTAAESARDTALIHANTANSSAVQTVAGSNTQVVGVYNNIANVNTVAGVNTDVTTVAGISSDVTTVAADTSDIGTVSTNIANVNNVGNNIANVNAVHGNASNINTVAADGTDIGTVATSISDVNTVAGISSDVTTVAGLESKMDTVIADASDIGAVAGNIGDVTTVAGINADVDTVAGIAAKVTTVADNISDVQAADTNATNAATSASNASASATSASNSATTATTKATEASNSATAASNSATTATTKASQAAGSATTAGTSASTATTKASEASASATTATTKAGEAASSASAASGYATTATTKAAQADASATSAASSATDSSNAASTWTNYYSTYLGMADASPTTDVQGNALQTGAFYYDTGAGSNTVGLYVYNGSAWVYSTNYNNVTAPYSLAQDLATNSHDISFGDNAKAQFGAGNDLQIYHDGSTSYIDDSGTGNLIIKSEDFYVYGSATLEPKIRAITNAEVGLYHNGSEKLATTSTGIDVTGDMTTTGNVGIGATSPANTLTVGSTENSTIDQDATVGIKCNANHKGIMLQENSGAEQWSIGVGEGGSLKFYDSAIATPAVTFQDNTGNVGIGTDSPQDLLHINSDTTDARLLLDGHTNFDAELKFAENGSVKYTVGHDAATDSFRIGTTNVDTNPRLVIDSSGKVGIGTTNPQSKLHAQGTGTTAIQVTGGASNVAGIYLGDAGGLANGRLSYSNSDNSLQLFTNNAERMRIDSSGNVLVGTTNANNVSDGIRLKPDGFISAANTSGPVMYANRLSTDGSILSFQKDGSPVGAIGSYSGSYLTVGNNTAGLAFLDAGSPHSIRPHNVSTNAPSDGLLNLGASSSRFKDIYRSGSTYSTSDRNKKQDIRDLTDAEARVAVVAKGSLKAFRYIDNVEAEGDDANIHFGIIAQDLKAAFEAEGLNADNYQVLKTSTYTGDDGVEQTTYSVCYENLLAFIISAI